MPLQVANLSAVYIYHERYCSIGMTKSILLTKVDLTLGVGTRQNVGGGGGGGGGAAELIIHTWVGCHVTGFINSYFLKVEQNF